MTFSQRVIRIGMIFVALWSVVILLTIFIGAQSHSLELTYTYFEYATGGLSLYSLDVDRAITLNQSLEYLPNQLAWSPDGTQLALGSIHGIDILELNGETQHLEGVYRPMWLSAGRLLGFASEGTSWRLLTYDTRLAQIETQPIRSFDYNMITTFLSPDGHWLAFTADDHLNLAGLFIANLETNDIRLLVSATDLLHSFSIAWSPDSERLVSSRWVVGARSALYAFNVNNDSEQSLTSSDDNLLFPSWSPDGTRLAFINRDLARTRQTLRLLNEDGSVNEIDLSVLTGQSILEMQQPEWSPDEQAVAVLVNTGSGRLLYLVWLDPTPTFQRLTNTGVDAFAWRP